MAPETGSGGYDERCDVWGAGAVAYTLALDKHVFSNPRGLHMLADQEEVAKWEDELFTIMLQEEVDFKDGTWSMHDRELKQLVQLMLVKDWDQRMRARDILSQNSWLKQFDDSNAACCCSIS
ncbi:unnamed protein product [Polarella glacialis]|uniref:Protein kinase domain-containing protein n=1 Tax=Polarella glacialis TaxID=89957 RepID=A0A813ELK5_POLGL|nr:unnamed protein product [Polarella glacialis]